MRFGGFSVRARGFYWMGNKVSSGGSAATPASKRTAVKMAASEWTGDTVRRSFIEYFKSKDHVNWPSSSVVPINDPTLLFANAGTFRPGLLRHSRRFDPCFNV